MRADLSERSLAFIHDHDAKFGHDLLRPDVQVGVRNRIDADDIDFTHLHQIIADHLIESIMTDLNAIRMLDCLYANFFICILGCLEGNERLGN